MLERLARPLSGLSRGIANVMNALYRGLGAPGRLLQDFLNGSWLGHALHPVIVDVVIGASTAAVLLLVLSWFGVEDLYPPMAWILGLVSLSALAAIVSGLTDFKDTDPGDEQSLAGMHGVLNIVATVGFVVAFFAALAESGTLLAVSLIGGYLVVSVGSFIGGHVVFKYGAMVNHNAFPSARRVKEFTAVLPVADLPEAKPMKAMLGTTALVVVRRGDVVFALKETCSHAGGPLSQGELRGHSIVCPWHGSTFRLADGAVRHGPAGTRQVAYRARINGEQVEVQGPVS